MSRVQSLSDNSPPRDRPHRRRCHLRPPLTSALCWQLGGGRAARSIHCLRHVGAGSSARSFISSCGRGGLARGCRCRQVGSWHWLCSVSGHSSRGVSCQPSAVNHCCTGSDGASASESASASVAAVASSPLRMGPSPHTTQAISSTGLRGWQWQCWRGRSCPGRSGSALSQVTARSARWVVASSREVGSRPQLEPVGEVGQVFQGLALAFGERRRSTPAAGNETG